MPLKILPFDTRYAGIFKDLNLAWLEKYFYVEPKDRVLLENCESSIIDKGGLIFFSEYNGVIVGCFSFIKVDNGIYELGKMAVDPKFQGLNIGQTLLSFAIDHAKTNKWNKILLYSNTKLKSAIYIYKKYGFKEIDLEKNVPYARSNIKMEFFVN